MTVLLIYTCIEIPFSLGFGVDVTLSDWIGVTSLVVDILLCIDIIINFRTAYFDKYDRLLLHSESNQIAMRYLKGWFGVDLITSFPFEFLVPDTWGDVPVYFKVFRVFKLIRLLKLLRFIRMLRILNNFMRTLISREMIVLFKLVRVMCLMILSAHFIASLFYYVGTTRVELGEESWLISAGLTEEGTQTSTKYMSAFYWAVVTLYTTGM